MPGRMEEEQEMERPASSTEKGLGALVIAGLILVFAPVTTGLLMLMFSFFKSVNLPDSLLIEGGVPVSHFHHSAADNPFLVGSIVFICGLIILACIGFRFYRKHFYH